MFESQTEVFDKFLMTSIDRFSNAKKEELIALVRKNKDLLFKEELSKLNEEQSRTQSKLQKSPNYIYAEQCYDYCTNKLSKTAREKLKRCLHYRYNEQKHKEKGEEENVCPICTQQLADQCKMVILNCDHHFHIECIEKWFKEKTNCPLCRNNLSSANNNDKVLEIQEQLRQMQIWKAAVLYRNQECKNIIDKEFVKKIKFKPNKK